MTASRQFGSFSLTVSLLAFLTAGSAPVSQAAPEPPVTKKPAPAVIEKHKEKAKDEPEMPASRDELIAEALKKGEITYEDSLRQRAFALYDDPWLQPRFQNAIVHGEDEMRLFLEVEHKKSDLSKALLADLAPFRARPSDPASVFNRPAPKAAGQLQGWDSARARSYFTAASAASPSPCEDEEFKKWKSHVVRGTNVRIWVKGPDTDLNRFDPLVGMVWRAFPDYFEYPLADDGSPANCINPDPAIDIYFMSKRTVGLRELDLALAPDGSTRPWGPKTDHTSSGYMMVDKDHPDDFVLNTIAHELTHVAQLQYDTDDVFGGPGWLGESTATYVGYKITKALGRTPTFEYDLLDPSWTPKPGKTRWPALFSRLHMSLNLERHQYSAWLFFESASIELGDGVARAVWQQAAAPGIDGIRAVELAIPLDDHFPRFGVRNWNRDLKPQQWPYKEHDGTFRTGLKPREVVNVKMGGPGIDELTEPVVSLASRYYHYTFADTIRKVTFENLLVGTDHAHVWAIKSIRGQWKEPEDWTKDDQHEFCRDLDDENLTDLVIVISNTNLSPNPHTQELPLPSHPVPRIVADAVGCDYIAGWAQASFRDTLGDNDVSYVSSRAPLKFKPLPSLRQNMSGNTQYYLMPTAVTWTASGKENDCTISGQIVINFPNLENEPLDTIGMQPAYGYMNVVGLDGGDFHSVKVSATHPEAFFKKTCPGDPPTITDYYSGVVWLLLVLSEKNTYQGPTVVFKGSKTVDVAQPMGFLDLLPPGTVLPDFAMQALQQAPASDRREIYTWNWELRPLNSSTTSGN